MSGDAHEWMSAHLALGRRISPQRVAELYRQDRVDSVLKFAKQIGVAMDPWQEWIIRAYFGDRSTGTEGTAPDLRKPSDHE